MVRCEATTLTIVLSSLEVFDIMSGRLPLRKMPEASV